MRILISCSLFLTTIFMLSACSTFETHSEHSTALEGKTFCRKVRSDESFGQPTGIKNICIEFKLGKLIDGEYTFFGSPAVMFDYIFEPGKDSAPQNLQGNVIVNSKVAYKIRGNMLINAAGVGLVEQKF